jgi:hypothetical protein
VGRGSWGRGEGVRGGREKMVKEAGGHRCISRQHVFAQGEEAEAAVTRATSEEVMGGRDMKGPRGGASDVIQGGGQAAELRKVQHRAQAVGGGHKATPHGR